MPEAQFTLALLNLLMTVLSIPKSLGIIPRKNPFIKKHVEMVFAESIQIIGT